MTFEDRLAELGVDLSDVKIPYDRIVEDGVGVAEARELYYADIIDRMETRIVNLTGERDYLRRELVSGEACEAGCGGKEDENGYHLQCEKCKELNDCYEFGVPEDWSADDA